MPEDAVDKPSAPKIGAMIQSMVRAVPEEELLARYDLDTDVVHRTRLDLDTDVVHRTVACQAMAWSEDSESAMPSARFSSESTTTICASGIVFFASGIVPTELIMEDPGCPPPTGAEVAPAAAPKTTATREGFRPTYGLTPRPGAEALEGQMLHRGAPPLARPSAASIKAILADGLQSRALARGCFERFDLDRSGTLDSEELVACMRYMNSHLGIGEFRDRDVAHYFRRFDLNSDGSLSEEEFEEMYRYLLLVTLNEQEPCSFCRDMFLGRRLGQPADHYDILAEVGKGSFGVVSRVQCKETRATRVLKTVDKAAAMQSGLPAQLVMEEIDKLKTLDHPAILRLFEYYVSETALHLITDHLSGGELFKAVEDSHLSGTPLREAWVRSIFHQVSEGVSYIHGKGVMHRDLKLENIMLGATDPPEAIIIDVGLAELFPAAQADTYHSSAPTGSIPTMAPQVLMHKSTYKCDVWSLGCCLFGLVCAQPVWFAKADGTLEPYPYPFFPPQDMSREELQGYMKRMKAGPDVSSTRIENGSTVRDLIQRMLAFQEAARPTMREVLGHPWLRVADKARRTLEPEQLDCLVNFQRASALEEAVLLNVASQLPLDELSDFRGLFRQADLDGDGTLDVCELVAAMRRAGLEWGPATEVAKKFVRMGPVEFSRFVAALMMSRRELLLAHLRDAFNRLDIDGDGFITAAELEQLLAKADLKGAQAGAKEAIVSSMFEALGGCEQISFELLSAHFSEICVVDSSP